MPEAITAAVAWIGAEIGGQVGAFLIMNAEAIGTALAVIGTASTLNAQQQRREEQARASFNANLKDRYLMVREALQPRTIVLGEQRVSGPMVFAGSYGVHKENLVFVLPVAGHEISSYQDAYWGNELLDMDGSGAVLGIRRRETFSLSGTGGTFTLQGKAKIGSGQATCRYGGEVDTLTATVNTGGTTVTVSGGRTGETGQLTVSYNPDPDPFQTERRGTGREIFVLTTVPQTFTLAYTPESSSGITVAYQDGEGQQQLGTFTLSGRDITISSVPTGVQVSVVYQYYDAANLRLSVRKYTGEYGQAADAGLISALPGVWTSAHTGDGVSYVVVEARYNEEAFPGGIENFSIVVRGLKPYDGRSNRMADYALAFGAKPGTPGTLPTGWEVALPSGVSQEVVGSGWDPATGMPYVDLRFFGSVGAAANIQVYMPARANGPAAVDAQEWSGRARIRRQAGTWNFITGTRLRVMSLDASNVAAQFGSVDIDSAPKGQKFECTGTIAQAGAARVVLSLILACPISASINCTVRLMLPQLWRLALTGPNNPERYTRLPALLARGYAVHPLGGRLPWRQVDHDEVDASASICATPTTYTVGGVDEEQVLYRCGYVARTDQQPTQVLNDLCQAMGGQWVYAGGRLRLMAGYYRAPTVTLDESWLIGDQPLAGAGRMPLREHFNALDGSFVDERQDWQQVPYTKMEPAAYNAEDRGEWLQPLDFAAVPWHGQVQYIGACKLRRARQGYTLSLRCNWRALRLQCGDVILVTLARIDAVAKPFEVIDEPGFELDSGIVVNLRETSATIWDMDAGFPAIDFAPNTTLPDPWVVPEVVGFDAFSGSATILLQEDGTVVPRFSCTWTAITDPRIRDEGFVEIRWGQVLEPVEDWQTRRFPGRDVQAYVDGIQVGAYYVLQARTVGAVATSDWTRQIRRLASAKETPPSDVANLSASVSLGQVDITWDAATDSDYLHTELRQGGTNWATATLLQRVSARRWAWPRPANGTYVIRAKHVDRSRNASTGTATYTVVVGDEIDGPSAVEIRFSRTTIPVTADTAGNVPATGYDDADCTIDVFENGVDRTSTWTIARTNGSGVTSTLTGTTTRTLAVTALSVNKSTITTTFTKTGFATQTRIVGVEKLKVLPPPAPVANIDVFNSVAVVQPTDALAGVRFNRDGTISVRNLAGSWITSPKKWYEGGSSTIGDSHWIYLERVSGDVATTPTLKTWLQISSARSVEHVITTNAGDIKQSQHNVFIAADSSGDNVVARGLLTVYAEVAL